MERKVSYSQCGEDRIVQFLFSALGIENQINYLDIGSAFPIGDNNTYLFYDRRATGVLVEADPSYGPKYNASRPDDIYINAACVPARLQIKETITFNIAENPGWSSVLSENINTAQLLGKGGSDRKITVPVISISDIMNNYFYKEEMHLLSIDIEGVDGEVLAEIDYKLHRPIVIIAENAGGDPVHDPVMLGNGYKRFGYTSINSIYLNAAHYERVMHAA